MKTSTLKILRFNCGFTRSKLGRSWPVDDEICSFLGTGNLRAVQEALGHASVAITQRYTAVAAREIRAVAEAAFESFESLDDACSITRL
jgi:integrase